MIDFRYHLVSLISVFLALAVGIVLGAGPLKKPIGDSLQTQVDSLRTDRDSLRSKLDTSNGNIDKLDRYITQSAPVLLKGTLEGQAVTIVHSPETDAQTVKDVTGRLTDAGATVTDGGELTTNSLSIDESEQLVDDLRKVDSTLPADTREALETAMSKALAGEHEGMYSADQARQVMAAFRSADRLNAGTYARAHALVFIMSDPASSSSPVEDYTGFITRLGQAVPTVVTGTTANGTDGLVRSLRNGKVAVSTVDGIELSAGAVLTALAVGDLLATTTPASYGFADSARALLPDPLPEGVGSPTPTATPTEATNG